MTVVPSEVGNDNRFHVGEVIRVKWKAPPNHSRKDWIGIYRVCACSLRVDFLTDDDLLVWGKQGQICDKGCLHGDVGART